MANPGNLKLVDKCRNFEKRIEALESGKDREKLLHRISVLEKKVTAAENKCDKKIRSLNHQHVKEMNSQKEYYEILIEDMERRHQQELAMARAEAIFQSKRADKAEEELERVKDESNAKIRESEEALELANAEIDNRQMMIDKLKFQEAKNHTNSNFASSQGRFPEKVQNSRKPSGKKPGAQPGSPGHRRKQHEPSNVVSLETPEYLLDAKKYAPTGKTVKRQLVNVRTVVDTVEYQAQEYRELATGRLVHAPFPKGVENEVNYGTSVKAMAFLLNMHCNVGIAKTSDFMSMITDGAIKVATGTVWNYAREFARKSKEKQEEIIKQMLLTSVMNIDFTTAKVNGKLVQVLLTRSNNLAMLMPAKSKGATGIEGTHVDGYSGTLVHDHAVVFYNYGTNNQECLSHLLRYLKSSMEFEPEHTWNKEMHTLIQDMIHTRNQHPGEDLDEKTIENFENQYDEILKLALEQYEAMPNAEFFKDGINTAKRMIDYRDNHLLFLNDHRVPATNNEVELLARILKRKLRQVTTFRSEEGLENACQALALIFTARFSGLNIYDFTKKVYAS